MTKRKVRVQYLIYPENKNKAFWELWITFILLISCITTPLDIAFAENENEEASGITFNNLIDVLFLIDILVIFNSAYYDDNTDLIVKRKQIAHNYLVGWFSIDLLAIIPFSEIINSMNSTQYNKFTRVARVGRLYKLVKLTKLFRILKVMKEKNKLLKYINDFLKIGLGFERLFFFVLVFFLGCHIVSCLWIIIASLVNDHTNDYEGTWLNAYYAEDGGENRKSNSELYTIAFYWGITTITTVGYGDVGVINNFERVYCAIIMVVGVIAFSFANGSLTSIIQNYDQTNANYIEKLNLLNKIYKDYGFPLELYIQIKKTVGYEVKKDINELNNFLDELPHKIKMELSLYIYEARYSKITFFQGRSASFITWMCPLLKPQIFGVNQYIYYEGELV